MENESLIIHCIRHGESLANAGQATSNPAGIPLTHAGMEQALILREKLRHLSPDLLVCSPYLRAQQTAAPTRGIFPDTPMETWPIHEFTFLSREHCTDMTAEQRKPWVQAFWNRGDPHFVDGEGAESFAGFMARVRGALSGFEALHRKNCRSVIVFGHNRFFLALRWMIRENPEPTPEAMQRFQNIFATEKLGNGTAFTATFNGRGWSIGQETSERIQPCSQTASPVPSL